jgi:Secretion system C-terminal sorting domain
MFSFLPNFVSTTTKNFKSGLILSAVLFAGSTAVSAQEICFRQIEGGRIFGDSIATVIPFQPAAIQNIESASSSAPVEYIWIKTTDETTVAGATANFDIITNSDAATYTPQPIFQTTWYRRLARYTGCADFNAKSNWVRFTVVPNPTPVIVAPTALNVGQTATLTTSGGVSYRWSNGATTPSINVTPTVTTTYLVVITLANGQVITLTKTIYVAAYTVQTNAADDMEVSAARTVTATETAVSSQKPMTAYPNPSGTGEVTIGFESLQAETVRFSIMDLSGRVLLSSAINATEGANQYQKDINALASGVYLLHLSSEKQHFAPQRFVKL